jgi:hypothetical protein
LECVGAKPCGQLGYVLTAGVVEVLARCSHSRILATVCVLLKVVRAGRCAKLWKNRVNGPRWTILAPHFCNTKSNFNFLKIN